MLISEDKYQFCHKAKREEKMETSITDTGLEVETKQPLLGEDMETSITRMVNSFLSISSPSSFLRGTLLWPTITKYLAKNFSLPVSPLGP